MKLKKGVAKAEIGETLGINTNTDTNNVCTGIDAVYALVQTIQERKGLKRNEKKER